MGIRRRTDDYLKYCPFKCGRTQSSLTGFTFRGDALKGCSEGSWRSGRRRSEGCWRRGQRLTLCRLPSRAGLPLSTCRAKDWKLIIGFPEMLYSRNPVSTFGVQKKSVPLQGRSFGKKHWTFSVTHCDLSLQCDCLLIVWIDCYRCRRILPCFCAVTAFKEDSAEQDITVDYLRIPKDR